MSALTIWRFHEEEKNCIGKWTKAFLETWPDARAAFEAARFMIGAPVECSSRESYWMMYAAQGWCRELVGLLDTDGCARLRELFDALYPKRDRMPVPQELHKALKKAWQSGKMHKAEAVVEATGLCFFLPK